MEDIICKQKQKANKPYVISEGPEHDLDSKCFVHTDVIPERFFFKKVNLNHLHAF